MERRTALAVAAAAAGSVLAAGAAVVTNVGRLDQQDPQPVEVLDASASVPGTTAPVDPTVVTIVIEDPAALPDAGLVPTAAAAVRRSDNSHEDNDHEPDDDGAEDDGADDDPDDDSSGSGSDDHDDD